MTMFAVLLAVLILFVAVDIAISAAVIYHLRRYTLPGWNAARVAVPLYLTLAALCAGLAVEALLAVPR